jgi:hypothetical protein
MYGNADQIHVTVLEILIIKHGITEDLTIMEEDITDSQKQEETLWFKLN